MSTGVQFPATCAHKHRCWMILMKLEDSFLDSLEWLSDIKGNQFLRVLGGKLPLIRKILSTLYPLLPVTCRTNNSTASILAKTFVL